MTTDKKLFQELERFDVIENWFIDERYDNENTIVNYRSGVRKFLVDFLKLPNPNDYPNMKRDWEKDILDFCDYIKDNSPVHYKGLLNSVKLFFEHYKLPYPTNEVKKFGRRHIGKMKPEREEKLLTSKEIKSLLSHGTIRDKSFYLVMLSGGLRPRETRSILLTDIDREYKPNDTITMTKIHIRKEISKNKTPRDTFINEETTGFLKEWLKERDEWLKKSQLRTYNSGKSKVKSWEDNRVFPFSESVQNKSFHDMLKKVGYVKKTTTSKKSYYLVLPKMFRNYFSTIFRNEIGIERVERLMGHEGYLPTYLKENKETLQDLGIKYHENQNILNIFSSKYTDKELKSTKKELEVSKKMIKELSVDLQDETDKRIETEQNIRDEMKRDFQDRLKVIGEYRQIISEVEKGKIQIQEYERDLVEEWGELVITLPDEGWDEFEREGYEAPFEVITILERLRKNRKRRRQ